MWDFQAMLDCQRVHCVSLVPEASGNFWWKKEQRPKHDHQPRGCSAMDSTPNYQQQWSHAFLLREFVNVRVAVFSVATHPP